MQIAHKIAVSCLPRAESRGKLLAQQKEEKTEMSIITPNKDKTNRKRQVANPEGGVEKSYSKALVHQEIIENRILVIRGQKVMLSFDLARLYGVQTKVLNQSLKRNIKRFPEDFVFQLSQIEADLVVSQNVTPHKKYFGGSLPFAFTEQGIAMLSGILNSDRAILVNIAIMRAFVKLRRMISNNKELAHKLKELEHKIERHDEDIIAIFNAIRQLMKEETPELKPKGKIGFL